MKLSTILIVCNEAANIDACVNSVSWTQECIVVEHGSTDDTVQRAKSLLVTLKQTPDWPGFGPQKNRAIDATCGDWILSIDADERVSSELAAEIKEAVLQAAATGKRWLWKFLD